VLPTLTTTGGARLVALPHLICVVTVELNSPTQQTKQLAGASLQLMKVMKQKENLGESLEEDKSPMSFELFQKLCQWFIETGTKAAVFAHCFLVLTWNLMCRSNNTVSI
jgi:hypothetical protein